jgi:uncharacterized protein (DUF362 family)/NAD-dependent dihydropyrimidine dehydrogenase PreA subunit
MDRNENSKVSIIKVSDSIESAVKGAINLTGGMESVVKKGDTIYLKPNFVAPRKSSTGATTDLEVIRVVTEEVRRCGGNPVLYETPAMEFDRKNVYDVLGVSDFAARNGIGRVEEPVAYVKVAVPGGKVFKSLRIPGFLEGAKIINLPKLKTHVTARMTCGMKNLIGLLPDEEKRRCHIMGVHASVADICKVLSPVLTVVDAVMCLEGDGPTYGDPKEVGLIVAGKNMVSVDRICGRIIGLPPDGLEYIRLYYDGREPEDIEIAGESVEDVQAPFKIPEKSAFYHFSTRMIHVLDIPFSKIFPGHLNRFMFSTGYFGTNPKIIKERCDRCGKCIEVCPVDNALKLDSYSVEYKKCIRCMECYLVCNKKAIAVKGFSRPEQR